MRRALMAAAFLLTALPGWGAEPTVGAHRTRVLKVWDDTVKTDDGDVARHVEVVFDYTDALAREIVRDVLGDVVSTREIVDEPPRPSAEEFQEAIATIQADPELDEMIRRTGGILEGGFLLMDVAGECGAGTRCVEVQILDRGRYGAIRKVVVDLVAQRIVIRALWPSPLVQSAEVSR